MSSTEGDVASQSRTRAARSPEVGAEKTPPVKASRAWEDVADGVVAGEFTAGFGNGTEKRMFRGKTQTWRPGAMTMLTTRNRILSPQAALA
jgi:hypothetical protein